MSLNSVGPNFGCTMDLGSTQNRAFKSCALFLRADRNLSVSSPTLSSQIS